MQEIFSDKAGVFAFNSFGLISFINDLNSQIFRATPFAVGAALNVNVTNFDKELARAVKKVENGASLLITYGKENIVPFDEIIGCKSNGRYKAGEVSFEIDGKKLNIARDFAIDLEPCSAEVVLSDAEGKPLLTKNGYGKGYIMFFNAPIESYFAKTPAVVESELGYEKIYSYAAKVAGIERIVEKHNHDLALTVHKTQENNWVVVAINNTDKEIQDSLVFNNLHLAKVYRGRIDADGNIVIPAADAVVFELK